MIYVRGALYGILAFVGCGLFITGCFAAGYWLGDKAFGVFVMVALAVFILGGILFAHDEATSSKGHGTNA